MVGALLSFSAMAVSIRELARAGLSIFEILAVRSGASLIVLFTLLALRPELRVHALPRRMGLNLTRNLVHYASQYGWSLSLTLLPLATVFALEFTMPAWTALLAVWLAIVAMYTLGSYYAPRKDRLKWRRKRLRWGAS